MALIFNIVNIFELIRRGPDGKFSRAGFGPRTVDPFLKEGHEQDT